MKTIAEAEAALLKIGLLERFRDATKAKLNDDIDRLKADASALLKPTDANIDNLRKRLKAWAVEHRSEVFEPGKKSRRITFGTVGFRSASKIGPLPKHKMADVLAALKSANAYSGIRVKESIDLVALRKWNDVELANMKARLIHKEEFYHEIEKSEIAEKAYTKNQI